MMFKKNKKKIIDEDEYWKNEIKLFSNSIQNLNENELVELYSILIDQYKVWINKDIPATIDWIHEQAQISFYREKLHLLVKRIKEMNIQNNFNELIDIDKIWQKQILNTIDLEFTENFPRLREICPDKSHWWQWLNDLNNLSEKETL